MEYIVKSHRVSFLGLYRNIFYFRCGFYVIKSQGTAADPHHPYYNGSLR